MERKLEYKMSVSGAKESQAQLDSVKSSVSSINDTFIKTVTAVAGATVAIKTLTSFYSDFVVQRNAVIGLDRAIQGLGANSTITTKGIEALASRLQGVSDIGDELSIKDIFTPLINSGVESTAVLEKLSTVIADTVAGTGNSVSAVTALFTRAINGNSQSLKTLAEVYKVSSDDIENRLEGITDATERAKVLTEALGGVYKGLGKDLSNPLTRLENALGDLKESVGKVFAPMVEGLANSATAWASNQENVENLIGSIKIASVAVASFGAIKLTKNISNGLNSIIDGYSKIGLIAEEKAIVQTMYNDSIFNTDRLIKSLSNSTESQAVIDRKAGLLRMSLNEELDGYNKSMKNADNITKATSKSMAVSVGALAGWVGIAISAVTIIYQVGKAMGKWGEQIESIDEKLQKNVDSINDLIAKAKEYNNLKFFSKQQLEEITKLEEEFSKLGITLDRQRLINDKNYLAEVKATAELKANQELLRDTYLRRNDAQERYSSILDKINKIESDGATKTQSILYNQLKTELVGVGEELNNLNNDFKTLTDKTSKGVVISDNGTTAKIAKDISALSKYYEMVKFNDSSYYDWRVKMNELESLDYKKLLEDKGYSTKEAEKERLKVYKLSNEKLLGEYTTWVDEVNARKPVISFEYDDTAMNVLNEILEKQKSAISAYYDAVGNADKTYYDYKKALAKEDVENQLANNLISQEQANLLLETKLNNLTKETEAYQNYASIAESAINSLSSTLTGFIKISTDGQSKIQQLWKNMANSIIAEISRIITKMFTMWVLEKTLGLLSGGVSSVTGGALPIGTGDGLPFDGGFASFPTSPIGSGSATTSPNTGTIRGSDDGIINKLNEVIDAININSIKGKIRTIDSVELARVVDTGNSKRSVL